MSKMIIDQSIVIFFGRKADTLPSEDTAEFDNVWYQCFFSATSRSSTTCYLIIIVWSPTFLQLVSLL